MEVIFARIITTCGNNGDMSTLKKKIWTINTWRMLGGHKAAGAPFVRVEGSMHPRQTDHDDVGLLRLDNPVAPAPQLVLGDRVPFLGLGGGHHALNGQPSFW